MRKILPTFAAAPAATVSAALTAIVALAPQPTQAMELRGHFGVLAPTSTTLQKEVGSVAEEKSYDTDLSVEASAELLFPTKFTPFQFGAGLGYLSQEKNDKIVVAPNSMPVWATIALKSPTEFMELIPFVEARVGWALPLTTEGAWWEKPANFLTKISLGAAFPGSVGITFDYTYTSFTKSYDYKNIKYKTSANHFGASVFVYFDIVHEQPYTPNTEVHEEEEDK
ncbi:MAG: hypothetical protein MJZ05_04390 [Fibrobacter sp.]|nr:hypothetical protein [Fibrobacter sp.]